MWNVDRGHASGGRGFDAEFCVFEDETIGGSDAEAFGSDQKAIWSGFAVYVVFGADEGLELVEEMECGERADDGGATAAGDDGEGNAAVLRLDVLDHGGDGLKLGKQFVIERFFARG